MDDVLTAHDTLAELRRIEQERRGLRDRLDRLDEQRALVEQDYPPSRRMGDRVRAARMGLGLSQVMLARIAGLHRSTISRIERGVPASLRYGTMRSLLIVFGASVDLNVYAY